MAEQMTDTGAVLRDMVARLVDRFNPDRIYLLGSRARGDDGFDSDYDLLVVAESELAGFRRSVEARRVIGAVGVPVDVFVYSPQEFEQRRTWLGDMAELAVREGRVLHDATIH